MHTLLHPQELLHHAELEDQAHNDYYSHCVSSMSMMSGSRHPQQHGGSLQDLVDAVRADCLLDAAEHSSCRGGNRHNSRQKKYSSVSSRQREGGSLPTNVNSKECPDEQSFLSEFNKRKTKLEKVHGSRSVVASDEADEAAAGDGGDGGGGSSSVRSPSSTHTIIEIEPDETQHLLAHDSLAQVRTIYIGQFYSHIYDLYP